MMRRCCITVLLAATVLPLPVRAEQSVFRAPLDVIVRWLSVEYGEQSVAGQAVILQGEPFDLRVGVVNSFRGPMAAAETDWLSRISLTLSRGDRFTPNRMHIADLVCAIRAELLQTEGAVERDGHVILAPSGAQFYRCRFDPSEFSLSSGPYTIEARWIDSAIASSVLRIEHDSVAPAVIQIEMRDVLTDADALDRDLHLAHRAIDEGRPEQAVSLMDDVLKRAPQSSTAHVVRGRARAAMGLCEPARLDWQQAALIIERGSDLRNRLQLRLRDSERVRAAVGWREKAREVRCP